MHKIDIIRKLSHNIVYAQAIVTPKFA